ncbi:MAG: hypothetical protein AAB534_00470 [Patescibacteria group bacterium]
MLASDPADYRKYLENGGRVAMSNKAPLDGSELEATQRIQTHFPRCMDPQVLAAINSSSSQLLELALRDMLTSLWKRSERRNYSSFEQIHTFDVVVPRDYDHKTYLAAVRGHVVGRIHYWNRNISDRNFRTVTTRLIPGQRFTVKVFQVVGEVKAIDCSSLMVREGAVMVGAQGAALALEQARDQLPMNRWLLSLDEESSLWLDGNSRMVPVLRHEPVAQMTFDLAYFRDRWGDKVCLLCFCPVADGDKAKP